MRRPSCDLTVTRSDSAPPPRWRSIFLLLSTALAIGLATHYLDTGARAGAWRNPSPTSTTAPSSAVKSAAAGSVSAKSEPAPIAGPPAPHPGPIASPPAGPSTGPAPLEAPAAAREIPRLVEELGRPVAVVSAQVIDSRGQPIAGVQVKLGDREAATDSQGEVVLPQTPADLVLRHPDHFPRTIDSHLRRGLAIPDPDPACERLIVVLFPGGRVVGRVTSAGGRPLQKAEVTFDGDESQPVVADAEGKFQGPMLRPGSHRLHVRHPEHQRADLVAAIPAAGGETPVTVVLEAGAPLALRVVDPDGAPLPDASIWLLRRKPDGRDEARYAGRTQDDGTLQLRWNPASPHSVRVLVPGYRETVETLAGESVVVRLERAPVLTGQVIYRESGLPVRPRELVLEVETEGGFGRAPDGGVLFHTLSAGRFRIGLPPFAGRYRVRALADGDQSGSCEAVAFDGRTDPPAVTVHLDRRTGIRGQVLASAGAAAEPVAGARVEIYRHDQSEALRLAYGVWFAAPGPPVGAGTTDAAGSFAFQDFKLGVYRVRVSHPDHAEWLSPPVSVPLDTPLLCLLREGATLRGSVLGPDASPQPGIPLILSPQGNPFTRFARSDEAGRYEFRDLAEGSYLLFAGDPASEGAPATQTRWAASGWSRGKSHAIQLRSGAEVIFNVERGRAQLGGLAGQLSADGGPLAGVPVRVAPARAPEPAFADEEEAEGESQQSLLGPELEVTTGPDGRFRLDGLEPGVYRVSGGSVPVDRTVEVSSGKTVELSLGVKTLSYRASLIDGLTGKPIEAPGKAELRAASPGPALAGLASDSARSAHAGTAAHGTAAGPARSAEIQGGRLDVSGLYPGSYSLRIEVAGFAPHEGRVVLRPDLPGGLLEEELRLRPGNALRVEVVGADDRPYRGTAESVLLKDGVEVHRSYGPIDGSVLLPLLPSGTYQLTIRTETGSTRMKLEVSRDDEVRARLNAEKPAR